MNIFEKISDMIIDFRVNRFLKSKHGEDIVYAYFEAIVPDEEIYEIMDHYAEYTGDYELEDEDAMFDFVDRQIVYRYLL